MRVRTIAMWVGLAVGGMALAPPVAAHEDPHEEAPVTTTVEGGVGIGDGIFLTGGTVSAPDGSAPRTFDAYHAAVWVQSWMPSAFFGGPDIARDPPPDLPVYRVDATGDWAGSLGTVTVYYATDGTTPYVAFPGIVVWSDPSQIPPPSNWFMAPARVIDAFNGEADLLPTTGTDMATSSSTTAPEEDGGDGADGEAAPPVDDSGSSRTGWVWAAIGAVVVAGAAGGVWLRRRRA